MRRIYNFCKTKLKCFKLLLFCFTIVIGLHLYFQVSSVSVASGFRTIFKQGRQFYGTDVFKHPSKYGATRSLRNTSGTMQLLDRVDKYTINAQTKDTYGYKLADHVRETCGTTRNDRLVLVSHKFSYKNKVQLCPMWKIGTTILKRIFMMKNVDKFKGYTDPYSISFLKQYEEKSSAMCNAEKSVRMLFVRNPYDRLLSGYVDKILAPNPVYWKIIGVPALLTIKRPNISAHSRQCGHDLTFPEYVKAAVMALGVSPHTLKPLTYKPPLGRDGHFEKMSILCKPCRVKYDFVGKLETFRTDVNKLLTLLDLPKTADIFRMNGSRLAAIDAIKDTTYQPFDPGFQKGFRACGISRSNAIKRAWLKLKMRGLIGRQGLNLTEETMKTMTYNEFLEYALNANRNASKQECADAKRNFYTTMYQSLDSNVIEAVKIVYADDFKLFQYNNSPF